MQGTVCALITALSPMETSASRQRMPHVHILAWTCQDQACCVTGEPCCSLSLASLHQADKWLEVADELVLSRWP